MILKILSFLLGIDTSSWVTDIGRCQYSKLTKDVRKVPHKFYIMRELGEKVPLKLKKKNLKVDLKI